MDEQTLSSNEVRSALAEYIVVKVDTDQFPESAVFYKVVGMPTLLVLNAADEEKFRSIGPITKTELFENLESLNIQ